MPWRRRTRDTVRGATPSSGSDPVLATSFFATCGDDLLLDLDRSLGRAAMGTRGLIVKAGFALVAEAFDPAVGALTRDPLGLGGVGDSPTLHTDTVDQQLPAPHVQTGVTV